MQCAKCQHENPEGARFCNHCAFDLSQSLPFTESTPGSEGDRGERRQATVLFSDLSGFTAMTERLDPEEVKAIMGRIFAEAARVIVKYGGTVEKYIGDAVMALFGVPTAHEDDPLRAVHAAREIHAAVEKLSPEVEASTGRPISMHSGINTGLVVTGRMDTEEGTMGVVGDTVNLASRLTGLAGPGEIVLGANTHAMVSREFECEALTPARVKGKADQVRAFRVLAPYAQKSPKRRFAGLRAGLVGRDKEMASMREVMQRLREGQGSVITFSGEAGSGKSRLVEEFRAGLPDGITWLEGVAHDHTQGTPYYPIIGLFNQEFGIEEGDSLAQVRGKLEQHCEKLADGGEPLAPWLGTLYALEYPETTNISAEYRQRKLHEAVERILRVKSRRLLTVIYMEDLHWADPSTRELVRHLAGKFTAVLVCAYRPPFKLFPNGPPEALAPFTREFTLTGLSYAQSRELAGALLEGAEAPPELLNFLQDKAGGNPFFLEEVLTSLIESKALLRKNGAWELSGSLEGFNVPSTVQGVIAARLDRLEPGNRRLLQEASVIGRSFLYELLKRTASRTEDLSRRLDGLEAQDLIRAQLTEPDLEYLFKHPLTQEVVYNSLLISERRAMHQRVGTEIEELLEDRLPEFYERLAHHFLRGNDLHRAVNYLIKSGEKAVNRFALDEAHQYFQQAYDLLSAKDDRTETEVALLFELLDKWGYVYYYFANFGDLLTLLRKHQAQAETIGDKALQGMFLAWLGLALYFNQHLEESHHVFEQAMHLGEESGDQRVIGYVCTWWAFACGSTGQFSKGIDLATQGHEIAHGIPEDDYLHFKSLGIIGFNYFLMGDAANTRKIGEQLLEYGEQTNNPRALLFGHWIVAWGFSNAGDMSKALEASENAVRVSKDPFYARLAWMVQGSFRALNGDLAPEFLETIEHFRQQNVRLLLHNLMGSQGVGLILQGRMAEGFALIEEGSRKSFENGDLQMHILNEMIKGKVYLNMVTGKPPPLGVMLKNIGFLLRRLPWAARRAEALLGKASDFYGESGAYGFRAQCLLDLGFLHKHKKRDVKARECLSEAVTLFEQAGATVYLRQAREALTELG